MENNKLVQQKLNEIHDALFALKTLAENRDDILMVDVERIFSPMWARLELIELLLDQRDLTKSGF